MALLNSKIIHCIHEGLKGNYTEDNGEYGWWDAEDHHYFEATSDSLYTCSIHWYGKDNPESNVDISDSETSYYLDNVVNIEVIGNKLLITQQDGTETYIQ